MKEARRPLPPRGLLQLITWISIWNLLECGGKTSGLKLLLSLARGSRHGSVKFVDTALRRITRRPIKLIEFPHPHTRTRASYQRISLLRLNLRLEITGSSSEKKKTTRRIPADGRRASCVIRALLPPEVCLRTTEPSKGVDKWRRSFSRLNSGQTFALASEPLHSRWCNHTYG